MFAAWYWIESLRAFRSIRQAFALRKRYGSIVGTVSNEDRRLQSPHLLKIVESKADEVTGGKPKEPMLGGICEGSEGAGGEEHSARSTTGQFHGYGATDGLSYDYDVCGCQFFSMTSQSKAAWAAA